MIATLKTHSSRLTIRYSGYLKEASGVQNALHNAHRGLTMWQIHEEPQLGILRKGMVPRLWLNAPSFGAA